MILIIGISGAGKSFQGRTLSQKLNCSWVSLGSLLRQSIDSGDLRSEMLAGHLLDDSLVIPLLDKELKKLDAKNKECVLDGSPRTIAQAQWLVEQFRAKKIKFTAAIHLKVSEPEARRRLIERGRPDDNPQAIDERFEEYQEVIIKIIDFLKRNEFTVYEVSGEAPPPVVADKILAILGGAR